ncbi:MAG: hypothetical protein DRH24_13575 [Deltaproteobacteria bacterium]|nr:MAG: hypothetical protein DRH24_13575 [Deltaproteobacteria bacterium]
MLIRPILLKKLIDKALGSKSWLSWEPETLKTELDATKIPELSQYKKNEVFTNIVDAVRAILAEDSEALTNWHIFENVATAFSGKAPDFYETTPPATHEMYFALRFLEDFFPTLEDVFSVETMTYIGSLFMTDGIYVHLHKVINNAIDFVAEVNELDITEIKKEQTALLNKLGSNTKLLSALSASVSAGGEGLDVSDKATPDNRRALQILTAYLFLENSLRSEDVALKDFLKDVVRDVPATVAKATETPEAAMAMENITDVSDEEADDHINSLINTDSASIGGESPEDALIIAGIKAAEAIPGLAGFNYHAGQLYDVTNEIGRDDVPKSKLLHNNEKGDVLLKGSTTSGFSSDAPSLKVVGKEEPKKKPTAEIPSPTDSSLELAEI